MFVCCLCMFLDSFLFKLLYIILDTSVCIVVYSVCVQYVHWLSYGGSNMEGLLLLLYQPAEIKC